MKKNGFTLIELLVVIAIIALLLSIITPALNKAKARARVTVCSAGLHSIGLAAVVYAMDNDDKLSIAPYGTHITCYAYGGGNPPIDLSQLYATAVGNLKVWTCPAVPSLPIDDPENDYRYANGSVMDSQMVHAPDAPRYCSYFYFPGRTLYPHFGDANKTVPLKIGNANSRNVILQDQLLFRKNNWPGENGWWANHSSNGTKYTHANPSSMTWVVPEDDRESVQGANLLFYDAHVDWMRINKLVYVGDTAAGGAGVPGGAAGGDAGRVYSVNAW